jgi:hypothetical protein
MIRSGLDRPSHGIQNGIFHSSYFTRKMVPSIDHFTFIQRISITASFFLSLISKNYGYDSYKK